MKERSRMMLNAMEKIIRKGTDSATTVHKDKIIKFQFNYICKGA